MRVKPEGKSDQVEKKSDQSRTSPNVLIYREHTTYRMNSVLDCLGYVTKIRKTRKVHWEMSNWAGKRSIYPIAWMFNV